VGVGTRTNCANLGLLAVCIVTWTANGHAALGSIPAIAIQTQRIPELIAITLVIAATFLAGWIVRRKGMPSLRRLPPLDAIPDAIGRATETGTPVVYITGWGGDMGRPTTMASMQILSHLSQRAAEYNCRLIFPSHDPVIANVAEDTISQAASLAGRPEWKNLTESTFLTQSQFGYSAAIEGLVARERPGAVMLLGTFEGEALILAEAAHQSGAVTISGTDSTIQLSFFLVACDYTLIGEELFAASSMVSRDPRATASIWAQDWLKYLTLVALLIGATGLWLFSTDIGPFLAK
jgi:hypothetical protein